MGKVKVKVNRGEIAKFCKSQEVQDLLGRVGDQVVSAAEGSTGLEFGRRVHTATYTAICNVYADSPAARQANLNNNVLLKAIGSVGLPRTKGGG